MIKSLVHFFPDLVEQLGQIEDYREKPRYGIEELVFAAIMLHVFKSRSRNDFNNLKDQRKFALNYFRAFRLRLPHVDTVDLALRSIPPATLEELKTYFVKILIEKKIFYKFKILNSHYNISIDGTGIMKLDRANENNFPNAVYKIYNKGTENEAIVNSLLVLEAKLVCKNGFCISIATEWIENPGEEYEKQDCELKAFSRIAEKIKKMFPRLPICVVGDGLYPNKNIFKICSDNNWEWIFTFKDGCLKSVWEKIRVITEIENTKKKTIKREKKVKDENGKITTEEIHEYYEWINSIDYEGHVLSFVKLEYEEDTVLHRFIYLTSFKINRDNIEEIILNGRMRFKIENEGFNCQKNGGYNLSHKFSRTSENATKNYYTCLQIAHIFNQLFELQVSVKLMNTGRKTIADMWTLIKSVFSLLDVLTEEVEAFISKKIQVKFD